MRYGALLLLAICVAGCGSAETRDDSRPPAVSVASDSPPPSGVEMPDFGDPKPPIPAASKGGREIESTRDALLHDQGR